MIKKIFLSFICILITNAAFAIDKSNLNLEFFTNFNDTYLTEYVNTALINNHDLKQATLKVEEARQMTKISLGKELPSLSMGVDYLGIKIPELDNFNLKTNAFILPFVASYEPDFLLKNRDKTRAYKKAYEASKYEEQSVYISLLSDVATNYINLIQYDYLIENQKNIVEISNQKLKNDEKKFNRGVVDFNQLNRSKQAFEDSENTLNSLLKQRDIIAMQLAVLCGISANNNDSLKRGKLQNFEYTKNIPNEISSDVIFSRPDVLKSEAQLEKAKIDVRVARKEFLPSFNITGIWAFNTIASGQFFSWQSSLASLLVGATQDIFKGGQKVANLKMKKAQYEELFENYRQTDLNAVKEVNTALCLIKYDTNIDKNIKYKTTLELNNYKNDEKKFNLGVISSSEILTAKENLSILEQNKAKAKTQRLVDYLTLYKTVGGKL